jgi:hypothetical protein
MQFTSLVDGAGRSTRDGLEGLLERGKISQFEYNGAVRWRLVHLAYLQSIKEPDSMSDEDCENAAISYRRGVKLLEDKGRRVFHAVSSIATYEDNELGDLDYTLAAAKVGFAALASGF